jgi:hypothetical protein
MPGLESACRRAFNGIREILNGDDAPTTRPESR